MGLWAWIPGIGHGYENGKKKNEDDVQKFPDPRIKPIEPADAEGLAVLKSAQTQEQLPHLQDHHQKLQQQQQQQQQQHIQLPKSPTEPLTPFQRTRMQASLFLAGGAFMLLTGRVARNSIHKRYAAVLPPFYTTNMAPVISKFSSFQALEALNIATMGVASFGMTLVGGWMYALDVVNVEELRRLVRSGWGNKQTKTQEQLEDELEQWVAGVFAKKEYKDKLKEEKG